MKLSEIVRFGQDFCPSPVASPAFVCDTHAQIKSASHIPFEPRLDTFLRDTKRCHQGVNVSILSSHPLDCRRCFAQHRQVSKRLAPLWLLLFFSSPARRSLAGIIRLVMTLTQFPHSFSNSLPPTAKHPRQIMLTPNP